MISIDILCDLAKFLSKEVWNIECDCPLIINKRYRRTLGCYIEYEDINCNHIEISNKILHNIYLTTDVLLHELTHWHLGMLGMPNDDNEEYFENELSRNGASTTNVIHIRKYNPNNKIKKYVDKFNKKEYN